MHGISLKKLQNGSDIRGIAISGEPGEKLNLTIDETRQLSRGYLLWLCNKSGKKPQEITIAVGRDPRISGNKLKMGIVEGLGPYGVNIFDCGLASTPAMFMSTLFPEYNCDGAIMITASHLPYNRNGFKYFDKEGGLNKSDITEIITFAESDEALLQLGEQTHIDNTVKCFGKKTYPVIDCNLMETYCAYLRKIICDGVAHPVHPDKPLTGLTIAVDAGNGGGGFYARSVLKPLGADIRGSQFLDPDGTFPNHPPNPEDKRAMSEASMQVLASGADLGLVFDTDVDRAAAVDHRGREISRNSIVALAAALIAEEYPNSTVVTDSITSNELTVFLEDHLGLRHLRYKRGYRNVINKSIALNEQGESSHLAIETSGHAAFKENYFLDDGAYLAAKIVIKTAKLHREGKRLDSLIEPLKHPAEDVEVRLPLLSEEFTLYGDKVLQDLQAFAEKKSNMTIVSPNHEGIRLSFDHGWCLLRKSLHDPIMPLNIESVQVGGCKQIAETLIGFFEDYEKLDITPLLKVCEKS